MQHSKPRNPMVPALIQRNGAGVHQKSTKALRQAEKRLLQRKLKDQAGFVQHTSVC